MGAKKLEMAEKLKTKQLDEDGLFDLIKNKPGKKSAYDIKVRRESRRFNRKSTVNPCNLSGGDQVLTA